MFLFLGMLSAAASPGTLHSAAARVAHKLALLDAHRYRSGSIVDFPASDLNAYALSRIPEYAPSGVRDARLNLGYGTATAFARIDFLKLRHAQGVETNWLIARFIEGERPVQVWAHVRSSEGLATVTLDKVEISGVAVSGAPLDLLVQTFFTPLFPNAKIGQPFHLAYGIKRLEITPRGVRAFLS